MHEEIVSLDPRRLVKWDWDTKYITINCTDCPLLIPPPDSDKAAEDVHLYKMRNKLPVIPKNPLGICIYRNTKDGQIVSNFLIENKHNSITGCRIGRKKIEARARKIRLSGKLVKKVTD